MTALQTHLQTKSFSFEGHTIEYFIAGSGPAVVLLHGAGASARSNWQSTIAHLAPGRTVLALNLPGAGNTTWHQAEVSLDALSRLVMALVAQEKLSRFSLVGYSTGAMVALRTAAQFPGCVDKLVAIAPWLENDARMRFFFDLWGQLLERDPSLFARYNTLTALSHLAHGQMDQSAFEVTVQSFATAGFNADLDKLIRMNQTASVVKDLSAITAQTTVVGFSFDNICPVGYAKAVAGGVTGAVFVEIPAGHAGPWEATGQLNGAILTALAGA
jgi:pimeloyl-ACP methyl ester carboxylesterase